MQFAHLLTAIFAVVSVFSFVDMARRHRLASDRLAALAAWAFTCAALSVSHWPDFRLDLMAVAALAAGVAFAVQVRWLDRRGKR